MFETGAQGVDGAYDGVEGFGLLDGRAVGAGGPAVLGDVDRSRASDAGCWKPDRSHGFEDAGYG